MKVAEGTALSHLHPKEHIMPINLSDLRMAVDLAIEAMRVTIEPFVPDVPNTINPDEEFSIRFTVSNTAPGAIRFVNMVYHVKAEGNALLKPPPGAAIQARLTNDRSAPLLDRAEFYPEMFLFPFRDTLDVDESLTVSMKGKATRLGQATIKVHPHGGPDMSYLFPLADGTDGIRNLNVV
jgi:hypothetical protein